MPKIDRLKKVVKIQIKPEFTFQDWQLYDMVGATAAASKMNAELSLAVGIGGSRDEVRDHMYEIMEGLSDFGAYDTAVIEILEEILDEIYED